MDCYDRQGNPITLDEYVKLVMSERYKRVALTRVGVYTVSTVWLGMNHGWGSGPPVIFETMVFAVDLPHDLDCQRYTTEADARVGHEEMVTLLRATVEDEPPTP